MSWLPSLGWRDIDAEQTRAIGLDVRYCWQLLEFEWFGFGCSFYARPRGPRPF